MVRSCVRQFFLRSPAEEPATLLYLSEWLDQFEAIVSFNGRGFDLPILQTRFILHRLRPRILSAPHLDLLTPGPARLARPAGIVLAQIAGIPRARHPPRSDRHRRLADPAAVLRLRAHRRCQRDAARALSQRLRHPVDGHAGDTPDPDLRRRTSDLAHRRGFVRPRQVARRSRRARSGGALSAAGAGRSCPTPWCISKPPCA